LYRLYGGWWDGNPAHLKPPREVDLAAEVAALAGGPMQLADRAGQLAREGQLRVACELVEMAYRAAPDDALIGRIRSEVYGARAKEERSLMARGVFSTAAGSKS
jgi:alkyl sulfatase BDS1-like metallo-beta-lactamase superfamily hydrolase